MARMDPVYIEAKDVFFYKSKHRPSQIREISDMNAVKSSISSVYVFSSSRAFCLADE